MGLREDLEAEAERLAAETARAVADEGDALDGRFELGRTVRLEVCDLDDLDEGERRILARRIAGRAGGDCEFVLGAKLLVLSEDQARRFLESNPAVPEPAPGLQYASQDPEVRPCRA